MTQRVALILLDAFRWDYLSAEHTPYLHGLAQDYLHVERVVPGAGFCERSEILTGAPATVTGNYCAIAREPESSPYRGLNHYLLPVDAAWRAGMHRTAARWINRVALRRSIAPAPYRIPPHMLRNLSLSEDKKDHRWPGAFVVESLLDVLRSEGKTVAWHFTALGFRNGDDEDRMREFEKSVERDKDDFYCLYVQELDASGHAFGPESDEMRASLKKLDDWLARHLEPLRKRMPDMRFVILGDHGMTPVKKHVNVLDAVSTTASELGYRERRDYEIFLDSTLARLWVPDVEKRWWLAEGIRDRLKHYGSFIDAETAGRYEIPLPDERYGDIVWWAKPGVLISPSYFHDAGDEPLGMHGYDPSHVASHGMAIVVSDLARSRFVSLARLRDFCVTMCDLLEVRAPVHNAGRTVMEGTLCRA